MKKLTIILYVILTLLFSSLVSAALTDGLISAYTFEDDPAAADLLDQVGTNDSISDDVQGRVVGKNNFGWNFSLPSQDDILMPFTNLNDKAAFTMSCWANAASKHTTDDGAIWLGGTALFTGFDIVQGTNALHGHLTTSDGGGEVRTGILTILGVDSWYLITIKYNGTHVVYFINDTQADIDERTNLVDMGTGLYFGARQANVWNYDGILDECYVWSRALTDSEIVDLWKNGDGAFYPTFGVAAAATAAPTIAAPSPADNSHNNTNVTLNVTHATANNDVRYYLYFDDVTPLDETDLYVNNATRTGAEYKSFTTNVTDGVYYWKWKVQNITSGVFSTNTSERTLYIDTVTPTITLGANGDNNFSTDNSTIISNYLNNLSIDISFFDTYLAGGQTLINITNESDQSVYFKLNTSITGTYVNFSETINLSFLSIGNYTIKLIATDSHTALSINDYDIFKGINYLRYKTDEGNVIKIKSDTFPLTFKTTKLKDRYNFNFNYLFQKDTYKFIIESDNKITYLPNSEYPAHFVIIGGNGEGNWIDFSHLGLSKKDYTVTKIDNYIYEVEIYAPSIKKFNFNSLGGLNKAEEHYKFRIGAVIDVWVYDENNYPLQLNATVTIGTQSINTTANVSGARLVNITKEITSLTLVSSGFATEDKTISITESYHNFSFNMTATNAIKIYYYDENSEALIEGETFEAYLETTGFSQTYSFADNPHLITALSQGLYKLKASSTNYPERQYLDLNISNITTTIFNVYLINNTLSQEVTFTVQGSGGAVLDNADINFFRTINGTLTLIAEETTDFAGKAKLYLDPNYEYNLEVEREGYISRNITLEPSETDYTIILLSGVGPFYENVYAGVRFRFYYNGIMSISPPDIINLTNTIQNITFEVEGADVIEIGINFTNHGYTCTPASCSVTLAGAGQVKLGILPNASGTFNTAYYFRKTGGNKIYVNDGLIKVIPFIFASLDSLPEWITAMKEELSPNVRTLLVAMLNVIAVGIGSSLGLAGAALIIPVLAITVICSLPGIGLIHPFIGMIISIFGVVLYVYAQSR